jgi:hypothetical protein
MARSLSLRDVAKNYEKQSTAFDRLAKAQNDAARAMPQGAAASPEELKAALAAYDLALRSYFTADSMEKQAAAYNQLADEAGEPA